jgi:DNA modification methylase
MSWKDNFPQQNRYFETDNGILYKGDCIEIMKEFPKESIDLIITDPPYGVNSNEINGVNYKDEYFNINEYNILSYNILKDNSRLLMFMGEKTLCETIENMDNFQLNQNLIWYKPNFASAGKRVGDFTSSYENILNFHKGKPPKIKNVRKILGKNYQGNYNILKYTQPQSNYKNDKRYHIHQKPIKLIEHLVFALSEPENIVLDTFVGSGTLPYVCEKHKIKWIGIEIQKEYCEITKQRIEKITQRK